MSKRSKPEAVQPEAKVYDNYGRAVFSRRQDGTYGGVLTLSHEPNAKATHSLHAPVTNTASLALLASPIDSPHDSESVEATIVITRVKSPTGDFVGSGLIRFADNETPSLPVSVFLNPRGGYQIVPRKPAVADPNAW